jgi:hypothetical protein
VITGCDAGEQEDTALAGWEGRAIVSMNYLEMLARINHIISSLATIDY